jgi:hypothetical protein
MQEHKQSSQEQIEMQSQHHDRQLVDLKAYLEKTVTVRVRTTNDIVNLKKIEIECAN